MKRGGNSIIIQTVGIVLLVIVAGCATPPTEQQAASTAAAPAAQTVLIEHPTDKYLGNVWRINSRGDVLFTRYFNQLTPEDGGKWQNLERVRDEITFGDLDRAYAFAAENELLTRHHTLVWGNQQPDWIADLPPEEQLEELTEMMMAVGERFPDIDFVDVVNEPLHAPPPYAAALGGPGETGWDWVITSFEMAREYFPNSALHINDYSITSGDGATTRYLEVIGLLQERGLIDGIGLQGHFLEGANLVTVANNLDRLAATGLPIYVTELDVDIADDVAMANRFRDEFTLFWEHPAVRGVTFWGYVQRRIWRQNAWLLTDTGQNRLAMDWLISYMAGNPIDLPDPNPGVREGNDRANRIEAEDWDDVQSIDDCGTFICYVDGGDWVMYSGVYLRPEYSVFTVRYGKGNDGPNAIHVRLDSRDAEDVAVISVTNTGGWNDFASRSIDWPSTEGLYDVYLVFDGGEGVGNIDWIEFAVE
jgi:endo-1,4-beta-xylanase